MFGAISMDCNFVKLSISQAKFIFQNKLNLSLGDFIVDFFHYSLIDLVSIEDNGVLFEKFVSGFFNYFSYPLLLSFQLSKLLKKIIIRHRFFNE